MMMLVASERRYWTDGRQSLLSLPAACPAPQVCDQVVLPRRLVEAEGEQDDEMAGEGYRELVTTGNCANAIYNSNLSPLNQVKLADTRGAGGRRAKRKPSHTRITRR